MTKQQDISDEDYELIQENMTSIHNARKHSTNTNK